MQLGCQPQHLPPRPACLQRINEEVQDLRTCRSAQRTRDRAPAPHLHLRVTPFNLTPVSRPHGLGVVIRQPQPPSVTFNFFFRKPIEVDTDLHWTTPFFHPVPLYGIGLPGHTPHQAQQGPTDDVPDVLVEAIGGSHPADHIILHKPLELEQDQTQQLNHLCHNLRASKAEATHRR